MPLIVSSDALTKRKREFRGEPLPAPRNVEVQYRSALFNLTKLLSNSSRLIADEVRGGASHLDALRLLEAEIKKAKAAFDVAAAQLPQQTTASMTAATKAQTQGMLSRALGVDFVSVIDTPEIAEAMSVAQIKNTGLIKSIASEHFNRVSKAISDNYSGNLEGSLTQELMDIGGITRRRAKFIARDQTSKMASEINEIRQRDIGIDDYDWRTSRDIRVVGTPGGLYPKGNKAHGDHFKREGKRFKWSEPPEDGHPGHAPGCRCRAQPVINLDKLNATYV